MQFPCYFYIYVPDYVFWKPISSMCMSSYSFRHSIFIGLYKLFMLLLLGYVHVDSSAFSVYTLVFVLCSLSYTRQPFLAFFFRIVYTTSNITDKFIL